MSARDYAKQVKDLSKDWRQLTPEQRSAFEIQAKHEEISREKLKELPLPSKSTSAETLQELRGDDVGHKARQKLAAGRLLQNFKNAENHHAWKSSLQMGNRSLVARMLAGQN